MLIVETIEFTSTVSSVNILNLLVLRLFAIIVMLGICGVAKGQLIDTLQELFHHRYNIDGRLESRYSFIDHKAVTITGVRLGVSFARKLRMGGGVSWLKSDFSRINGDGNTEYLKLGYLAYYMDFVFYKTKRWQLSVPIQIGTGMYWYQDKKEYYFNKHTKYLLLLYEPCISTQFKVFKWLGGGVDVGYRWATGHKGKGNGAARFSDPTYAFKLLIWFDQIYYEAFPESALTKKYGPAYW